MSKVKFVDIFGLLRKVMQGKNKGQNVVRKVARALGARLDVLWDSLPRGLQMLSICTE